jgi:hypothetical protein
VTLDAITGISPEYQVKNRKQVLTRADGLNRCALAATRGPKGARPAGANGTLARLPEHVPRATPGSNMATARHSDLAVPGGSLHPRGGAGRLSLNGHQAAVGQVGVGLLGGVIGQLDAAEALLVAVAAAREVMHGVAAVEI